jgi:hypothetical protein
MSSELKLFSDAVENLRTAIDAATEAIDVIGQGCADGVPVCGHERLVRQLQDVMDYTAPEIRAQKMLMVVEFELDLLRGSQ